MGRLPYIYWILMTTRSKCDAVDVQYMYIGYFVPFSYVLHCLISIHYKPPYIRKFRQLLRLVLEIFGKGKFHKQAMIAKFLTSQFNFALEIYANSPPIRKFPSNENYPIQVMKKF